MPKFTRLDIDKFINENQEPSSVITEMMQGRQADLPSTETYSAQLDPKLHDVMDLQKRPDKKVKDENGLTANELADNGIIVSGGESGTTKYRIEKVARIALAIQKLIVKRAVAFTFGNPVTLNAEPSDEDEKKVLDSVKAVLFHTKSRTVNRRVAREIYSSTEAAELWYLVEGQQAEDLYGFKSPFKLRVAIFSPLKGDRLFPYFDDSGDMVAFSRQYTIVDEKKVKHEFFETYTEQQHIIWYHANSQWQMVEGYPKKNEIGKIPVIYGRQPAVEWQDVQGLIDRLETLLSNFADTNDYHASPKIVVKGDIIGWAKKGDASNTIEMDENGSAEYLTWSQAPESVKLEIDTLLRMIYTITQTPDIAFDSVKGIGAVSGVALRLLFMDAHLKVQDKMEIFDDYLQRRISVIKAFLKKMNTKDSAFAAACSRIVIEPEIEPYMLRDESTEISDLLAANGNKAIASRRTTIQRLGWVKDVDEELDAIEAEDGAASFTSITEPTI